MLDVTHKTVGRWVGAGVTRPEAIRFVEGRGRYLDDVVLPGMLHAVFLRSPFARCRFRVGDLGPALAMPGIAAILTGADLAKVCRPWQLRYPTIAQHVSAPQHPLAIEEACWQGEAVVAVVASSRALAEDALEFIEIDWEELEPVVDPVAALADDATPCHAALTSNLALDRSAASGDVAQAFQDAACVVRRQFVFGRQTGVPLEPRGIIADFDRRVGELRVHVSHQVPFQVQAVMATQLGLEPEQVRVMCPDVGGAFGIKLHAYPDEMAVAAIAVMLERPVKYQADRLESFVSDIHARDAKAEASLALDADGHILGLAVDMLFSFGAYSCYPRSSLGEAIQAMELCGAAYAVPAFQGRVRGVFLNKATTGAYRAVGQPIACAVIEQLLDDAAEQLAMDPLDLRALNHRTAEADTRAGSGLPLGPLSTEVCLRRLADNMDYAGLRAEQARLRPDGVWRGIGLCTFVELTGVGSGLYGPNDVPVAGKESVRLSLSPTGRVTCRTSTTDQGQGTRTGLAQIIADELGIDPAQITVNSGDTETDPFGGGAWASRGIALAGEAAMQAAQELGRRILRVAEVVTRSMPGSLHMGQGGIMGPAGDIVIGLAEVGKLAHYHAGTAALPEIPQLTVERSCAPVSTPYFSANGIHGALIELDPETGMIRVLKIWVVEDCGRLINPLLADEQVRGGVVQGIGAALFEECDYSDTGQMTNASLADYLLPMASEMPDIDVDHVSTLERETQLGAKGVGEAGTVGAIGALWCAVNDALRHTGVTVGRQPFTPARILEALYPETDETTVDR